MCWCATPVRSYVVMSWATRVAAWLNRSFRSQELALRRSTWPGADTAMLTLPTRQTEQSRDASLTVFRYTMSLQPARQFIFLVSRQRSGRSPYDRLPALVPAQLGEHTALACVCGRHLGNLVAGTCAALRHSRPHR